MPILSVVVFFLLIYLMLRRNSWRERYTDLFVTVCVLKLYWFQGYFLKLGQNEITNTANIASYCLLLYSIYLVVTKRICFNRNILLTSLAFVFIICLGMLYEKLLPYDGLLMPEGNAGISWDDYVAGRCSMYHYVPDIWSFLRSLNEVVVFVFEVLVFKQIFSFEWFVSPYMRVVGWLKYAIYYGYFEFVMKNVIGNLTFTFDFAAMLLGVNEKSVYTEAQIRNGIFYSLQGLTREPSHFNCVLFNIAILMILGNILRKIVKQKGFDVPQMYTNVTLLLCLGLMLLTGGFSAVWFLFVIACCWGLLSLRGSGESVLSIFLRHKVFLVSAVVVCMGSVFFITENDYLYNRLVDAIAVVSFLSESNGFVGISMISGDSGIGSTIARFVSIYEGWQVFLARPLLGLSWRVQGVHDFSIYMLMNMGILGVYALYRMLAASRQNFSYDAFFLGLFFLLGGLPTGIGPGGLCLHWLLFFEATAFYMNMNLEN